MHQWALAIGYHLGAVQAVDKGAALNHDHRVTDMRDLLAWLRTTITAELESAAGLLGTDVAHQLGAALLGGDDAMFVAHVQANSQTKLDILSDCVQVIGAGGPGAELAYQTMRRLAYGYRFRPGWKDVWTPQ